MTAYRERGTDRLHLVDAEPAEVGITILCGPKRTPENCTRTRRGAGVEVLEVQPSEAKKRLAGVGNADKQQMQAAVLQRYGAEVAQDVADAVGMAEHAQRTARLRAMQPELIAERED